MRRSTGLVVLHVLASDIVRFFHHFPISSTSGTRLGPQPWLSESSSELCLPIIDGMADHSLQG